MESRFRIRSQYLRCGKACIPSRAGFTVRNHLATGNCSIHGSDLFVFHGFTEFSWKGSGRAAPAFNSELCARFGVLRWSSMAADSIFQSSRQAASSWNMLSLREPCGHSGGRDYPSKAYGQARVEGWIENYEKFGNIRQRRFDSEEILP
jgi:hypothetical protein